MKFQTCGVPENVVIILIAVMFGFGCVHRPEEGLFRAEGFTEPGLFTEGIEGPACDREGNVYVVNFGEQGTIGRVSPEGKAELFVRLPAGSIGNGIVFDRTVPERMFVADYTGHNVLAIDVATRKIEVLVHDPRMNQPNDLAIAPDGTLYASDPSWKAGTGQLWRIDRKGGSAKATLLERDLGTTNGIEVSPDGKTLYVNESVQRKVWAWRITEDGLAEKRLVREFADFGFDGMLCDVDGNLYITRHGKGTVVKLSPSGEVLREVDVLGSKPSNLCFGGADGRTVYVTEVERRRLVRFRVDRAGLARSRLRKL
jgi:gluconolactonase